MRSSFKGTLFSPEDELTVSLKKETLLWSEIAKRFLGKDKYRGMEGSSQVLQRVER
jgi:hypothetical protein